MFASNKKNATNRKDYHSITILTDGCEFTGKLFCRGASRIGGKVEGEIVSEGLLIVEGQAQIKGTITAEEIVVQGHIEGEIFARAKLEMTSTAVVIGQVKTPSLIIQEGAKFMGTSSMDVEEELKEVMQNQNAEKKGKEQLNGLSSSSEHPTSSDKPTVEPVFS